MTEALQIAHAAVRLYCVMWKLWGVVAQAWAGVSHRKCEIVLALFDLLCIISIKESRTTTTRRRS